MNCPLPLGYNHDVLINARDSNVYDRFLQGSVDASFVPPQDYVDILCEDVMPVAPQGLDQLQLSDGNSTAANEAALTAAIMEYAIRNNKSDISDLSVLGFSRAAHGCTVATLSCSDPAANAGNVPTYDWPIADSPTIKYPYSKNEHANIEEEERCYESAVQQINERRSAGKDVAAIIVEPISSLEMRAATPNFFKKLRNLAKTEGIPFIVDETKSGMGQTGKMWGHELWFLQDRDGGCPDFVTFGGKAGISGFFATYNMRQGYAHCGSQEQNLDMSKVLTFGITWRHMQYMNMLELV